MELDIGGKYRAEGDGARERKGESLFSLLFPLSCLFQFSGSATLDKTPAEHPSRLHARTR
jgi:hypothetical protein